MQKDRLGVDDLSEYMHAHDIPGEILHLSVPTPTVETAAQAVGTSVDQIIKSILFLVDEQPVLAIACGLPSIQRRAIADLYGVGKKRVKLAAAETVLEISGYEVGAMPPFGHRQPLVTLIDTRVLGFYRRLCRWWGRKRHRASQSTGYPSGERGKSTGFA